MDAVESAKSRDNIGASAADCVKSIVAANDR